MTTERERLIKWAKQLADPNWCLSVPKEAKDTITALLKELESRTVTTVEELAKLPDTAVIRDKFGEVNERRAGKWCGYEQAPLSDQRMGKYLPATVLDEATA